VHNGLRPAPSQKKDEDDADDAHTWSPEDRGPLVPRGKGGLQELGYRLRSFATAPSAAQDAAGGSRADPTRRGDERRGMRLEICVTNRPCFGRYSQLHPEAY
jgi:hypothetical protein